MQRRPSPPLTIVLLLGLCLALVGWQALARRGNRVSLPENVAFLTVRPLQRGLLGCAAWLSDVGAAAFHRNGLLRRERQLADENARFEGQNRRLLRYYGENRELRALLKMPPPAGGREVAADVVSLDFSDTAQRLLVNAGSRQGVRAKDVVYNAQGVIGHVISAGTGSAQVLLLTDRQSGIGAMIGRTAARGIVEGTGGASCKMSYLDFGADVRQGDVVLTSGDGEIFPRGLVIGRIMNVERNKTYSRLTAAVDPAVPLDRVSVVYIRVHAGP